MDYEEFPDWQRAYGQTLGPDLSGFVERSGYNHPDAADGARGLITLQAFDQRNVNPNTQYFQCLPSGYYNQITACLTRTAGIVIPTLYMRLGKLQSSQGVGALGTVADFVAANPPQYASTLTDAFSRSTLLIRSLPLTNAPFFVWFRDDSNAVGTGGNLAVILSYLPPNGGQTGFLT